MKVVVEEVMGLRRGEEDETGRKDFEPKAKMGGAWKSEGIFPRLCPRLMPRFIYYS